MGADHLTPLKYVLHMANSTLCVFYMESLLIIFEANNYMFGYTVVKLEMTANLKWIPQYSCLSDKNWLLLGIL